MPEKLKISCLYCGTLNRFPMDSLEKKVVCGRCKNPLQRPGEVLEPTPKQTRLLIQNSKFPFLIDFFSPACSPCQVMHPVVEKLAQRRAGELMVLRVNTDKDPDLAVEFGIQAVPTFVIISRGYEMARTYGALSETDFSLWVASRI